MKIKLDEQEVAAIVKDWCKNTYKTNNIAVELEAQVTASPASASIYANVEVTMKEDSFAQTPSFNTEAFNAVKNNMEAIKKRMQDETGNQFDTQPDYSQHANNSGVPL